MKLIASTIRTVFRRLILNNSLVRSAGTTLLLLISISTVLFGQEPRQLAQEKVKSSDKRTALVIGNGNYQRVSSLGNPVNDATDMAVVLVTLGFEVIRGTDTNLVQMRRLIREFGEKLEANRGVGLFYYAGHGVEVRGKNFLVPVDADIAREVEIEDSAIDINTILRQMDAANNGFNIVVLDACRNNPFSRGWSRSSETGGLANVNAPTGTYIAFAAAPGATASDGKGTRNGIFTGALLKNLKRPNLKLEEVFKATREEVMTQTSNKQVPWDSSSIKGDFYFRILGNAGSVPTTSPIVNNPIVHKPQAPTNTSLIPFAKLMNEAFVKEYVGKSIRTRVQFSAAGQTQGWIFGAIPLKVMEGKVVFRVSESNETIGSETPFGSVPPHVFLDKDKADLVFDLKKGDSIILTGSPYLGSQSWSKDRTYTQIIFIATSIERAN